MAANTQHGKPEAHTAGLGAVWPFGATALSHAAEEAVKAEGRLQTPRVGSVAVRKTSLLVSFLITS